MPVAAVEEDEAGSDAVPRTDVEERFEVGHQHVLFLEEVDVVQVDAEGRDAEVLAGRGEFLARLTSGRKSCQNCTWLTA